MPHGLQFLVKPFTDELASICRGERNLHPSVVDICRKYERELSATTEVMPTLTALLSELNDLPTPLMTPEFKKITCFSQKTIRELQGILLITEQMFGSKEDHKFPSLDDMSRKLCDFLNGAEDSFNMQMAIKYAALVKAIEHPESTSVFKLLLSCCIVALRVDYYKSAQNPSKDPLMRKTEALMFAMQLSLSQSALEPSILQGIDPDKLLGQADEILQSIFRATAHHMDIESFLFACALSPSRELRAIIAKSHHGALPGRFTCPINLTTAVDPLFTPRWKVYEKLAINAWLIHSRHSTDPSTREVITLRQVTSFNEAHRAELINLKHFLQIHRDSHPGLYLAEDAVAAPPEP